MPTYSQKITLVKEVEIQAPNAEAANSKLMDIIQEAEFASGFSSDGYHDFEDEPVECPECQGGGFLPGYADDSLICEKCDGTGSILFPG